MVYKLIILHSTYGFWMLCPQTPTRTALDLAGGLPSQRQIRRCVPAATFQMLVVALVHSQLNYGNSVLVGIPAYLLSPVADLEGGQGVMPPLLNPPTYR